VRFWSAASLAIILASCSRTGEPQPTILRSIDVTVRAYCLEGKTASGLAVQRGAAAADIDLLPLGSVIRLRSGGNSTAGEGVYTVLDTGRLIKGRQIDVYIPKCADARRFGRQRMVADVLRLGWPPQSPGER
jgi:3D (Asp-Asp-Asp) domain-containing protein